jgi:hypothetical protein
MKMPFSIMRTITTILFVIIFFITILIIKTDNKNKIFLLSAVDAILAGVFWFIYLTGMQGII